MIHFEGDRSFPLPPAEVAAKLSDAAWLVGCLPDAQVSEATPDRAAWKLKPKLSFLSGSLDAVLEATGRDPGRSVGFRVVTKAIGASSTVTTLLRFTPADGGGTVVHWTGDLVEITGLLKMVPKGLIQATAQKVIEDVWAAVGAKLGEPGAWATGGCKNSGRSRSRLAKSLDRLVPQRLDALHELVERGGVQVAVLPHPEPAGGVEHRHVRLARRQPVAVLHRVRE